MARAIPTSIQQLIGAPTGSHGLKKAAILMIALGEELSSKIMAFLDDEDVADLSKEIALTKVVPPEQIDDVIEEFYNMMLAKKFIAKGGLEYAKSVLVKSLGPERARKIIDRLTKMLEQSSGFEFLTKIDPKQLAKFIMNEHPQTIALILAHLDPTHAAESMAQLPEDLKAEVAVRIANLQDIFEFLAVGAEAVQIGTENFTHPGICEQLVSELAEFMAANDFKTIKELKESLRGQ